MHNWVSLSESHTVLQDVCVCANDHRTSQNLIVLFLCQNLDQVSGEEYKKDFQCLVTDETCILEPYHKS